VNVADLLRNAANAHPDRTALLFQGVPTTFSELDRRVDATAAALGGRGVGRGDRVGLIAGNVPEFVSTLYGILRAGAVACPLNVMLTSEELGYILADAQAKAVVTESSSLAGLLAVRDRLADLHTIMVIGGTPAPSGAISLNDALSQQDTRGPPAEGVEGSDLAVIAYTSGTTAAPKGAMLTHANLLANLDQMTAVPTLAVRDDDVVLLAIPLFHIYGLNAGLGMAVRRGAACLLMERFDPAESLGLIERDRVTVLVGAPPMFAAWLALPDPVSDLSSVRLAVSGASPLAPETFTSFRRRFGITIWEGYGLTECAPAVTSNAVGPEAKPGSIGLPLPGVDVRMVGERGEEVEDGDPGEIQVRGPNVFAGYWSRPEATAEAFDGEWFKTGDVAIRDENGSLYLVDRKKDLIIVSGFNVYPVEVEEAITRHPKVADAAVVGIPDPRTGEAVQAWVVARPGEDVTEEEILDFLHGYLARFKWPKEVRIVDEVPRHATGKLLRRVLRGEEILGSPELSTEPTA
jgi:long-chain acyl-CoA synthetase